jgi:hypothetical protein
MNLCINAVTGSPDQGWPQLFTAHFGAQVIGHNLRIEQNEHFVDVSGASQRGKLGYSVAAGWSQRARLALLQSRSLSPGARTFGERAICAR